jgi:alpha-galactosidase
MLLFLFTLVIEDMRKKLRNTQIRLKKSSPLVDLFVITTLKTKLRERQIVAVTRSCSKTKDVARAVLTRTRAEQNQQQGKTRSQQMDGFIS